VHLEEASPIWDLSTLSFLVLLLGLLTYACSDSLHCASFVLAPFSFRCQSWELRGSALVVGTFTLMTWSSVRPCEYIIDNNADESGLSHGYLVMIVPRRPENLDGVICRGYDHLSLMVN